MGRKPKAGGQKSTPPPDQEPMKPQIERFKDAARRAGADETGEEFERAFRKIVPPRTPMKPEDSD